MKSKIGKFKFLKHTADIKFRSYGNNIETVFSNSAYAMASILIEPELVKSSIKHKIIKESSSLEQLLYEFLEEFLFLMDTKGFMLSKIISISIIQTKKNFKIKSECLGDYAKNYDFSGDIKSITYHEMFIKKIKDKFVAQVVVDV